GIEAFARSGYGYIMFPEIGKGGLGIGGGYGRGAVYAQGKHIGYADMSQGSLGFLLGGQAYRELIVFEDERSMGRVKQGLFDVAGDTAGVVATWGYTTRIQSIKGITVFFKPIGGLIGDVTFGGQRFTFAPR